MTCPALCFLDILSLAYITGTDAWLWVASMMHALIVSVAPLAHANAAVGRTRPSSRSAIGVAFLTNTSCELGIGCDVLQSTCSVLNDVLCSHASVWLRGLSACILRCSECIPGYSADQSSKKGPHLCQHTTATLQGAAKHREGTFAISQSSAHIYSRVL